MDAKLDKHKKWLDGEGGERADLREANLRGADLYKADLRGANLRGARLLYLDGNIGRHRVFAAGGHIIIGCERHTYEHWLERGEEIGRANEYSESEPNPGI